MNQKKTINNKGAVIDLNDLVRKIIFHWPLYLIVILIAVAGALIFLKYKKPKYMSSAKLYLKDEKKGGEEMDMLKSLSLFNNSKNIENEMEVLRSPILLERVIRNNHFNIRYFKKGTVRNEEMYNNHPLLIQCLNDSSNVGNYIFEVTPEKGRYNIRNVDNDSSTTFTADPGQPFTVNKDRFSIIPNPLSTEKATYTSRIRVDSIMELAYDKADDIGTALVNKDATVVVVSYEDPVPERAASFLNALLETYNDYSLDDKNKVSAKSIRFLTVRIDSLKTELGLLERAEESFKVQRGITDIEAGSKLVLEQVKDADLKLNEANMQLSVFNQVENYVNNPSGEYPFAPVMGNVDQALTSMINRYEEQLKEKRRLSLSLQPGSIFLQNLDAQIADSKNTIRNYISGYKRNASVAQNKLQGKVNEIQGKIANIPAYEREYVNIKRQQSVKESLYLFLLKKKEEAAVAHASNVIDNKIIAPAFVPEKPVTPKKTLVFIGFIAGGLLLSTLYVYIKYFLNTKILNKKEIEQVLDLPVVGEIYQHEEVLQGIDIQSRSILQEQVYNMRTNLKFMLTEHSGSATILLTSSIPGEGKTFISAHLGNALSANGKKVVMVELDLRKPKLSHYLGQSNDTGITNYIMGHRSIEEIIKKMPGTEDLYLVSSGPIPPNPIELIEGHKMKVLLTYLKEQFDYVIIDMAPLGLVSDAKSLAPYIDCTLFVVRYNFTLKTKLTVVADTLRESFFKRTAIVFNGIERNTFYPYYYYDNYTYKEKTEKTNVWLPLMKKLKQRLV